MTRYYYFLVLPMVPKEAESTLGVTVPMEETETGVGANEPGKAKEGLNTPPTPVNEVPTRPISRPEFFESRSVSA